MIIWRFSITLDSSILLLYRDEKIVLCETRRDAYERGWSTIRENRNTPYIKGIEQAKVSGKELKQKLFHIDLIVCSPYERTYETAKLIANEIGYPTEKIQKNDMFIERTYGVLEGTYGKDFLTKHEYRDFDDVEGSETIKDLQKRAEEALKWLQSLKEDNVLVVGHSAFARAIKRVVERLPHTHEYEVDTSIGNATIVELV